MLALCVDESFVGHIDHVVRLIEANNARNIAILRYMQFGLVALAPVDPARMALSGPGW